MNKKLTTYAWLGGQGYRWLAVKGRSLALLR